MERVNAKFSADGAYKDGVLEARLRIEFTPYDCTDGLDPETYKEYDEGSGDEILQWLRSTIYNYIPFALIVNRNEGIRADINFGEWDEIPENLFWENTEFKIVTGWTEGEYGKTEGNLFTRDLKKLADENIKPEPEWYESKPGIVFAFSNALNGNVYFSHNTARTGFSALLHDMVDEGGDGRLHDEYRVWKNEGTPEPLALEMVTKIPVPMPETSRTYAVVAGNPCDSGIFTKYIYVRNEDEVTETKLELDGESVTVRGCGNKMNVEVAQTDASSVSIRLSMANMQWMSLHPQIRFRIKKKTETRRI